MSRSPLSFEIATVLCGGPGLKLPPHTDKLTSAPLITRYDNRKNLKTPCQCYQDIYLSALSLPQRIPDILIYAHDDAELFDPEWIPKLLAVFEGNPECVVAGLGGATELGREGLYKRPYRISDMARGNYVSAQRDWNIHGGLLSGDHGVVCIDAFFIAVRTEFLTMVNGWPVSHLSHHCLDLWICLEAARRRKQVRAIGIDCMHYGGGTSTKPAYRDAKWLQGGDMVGDHQEPHKWLHREYSDILPIRVKK